MPNEDPDKKSFESSHKSFESSHLMSPAPGTPQTKDKAWVGGLIAAVASAVVGYIASGQDVSLRGVLGVIAAGVAGYFGVALKSNRAKRDERGESWVVIGLVVAVVIIATVLLLRGCDGDRDHDGKGGQDWERLHVQTFESSH